MDVDVDVGVGVRMGMDMGMDVGVGSVSGFGEEVVRIHEESLTYCSFS